MHECSVWNYLEPCATYTYILIHSRLFQSRVVMFLLHFLRISIFINTVDFTDWDYLTQIMLIFERWRI